MSKPIFILVLVIIYRQTNVYSLPISGRTVAVDPMITGQIRAFDIESSKKETCALEQENYYVRKVYFHRHPISNPPSLQYCECKQNDCDVYFYASLDDKLKCCRTQGHIVLKMILDISNVAKVILRMYG